MMKNELQKRIDEVIASTAEGKERIAALMAIKWVLATNDGWMIANDPVELWKTILVRSLATATQYSGMDNHEIKARFFMAIMKQPLTVVLLD